MAFCHYRLILNVLKFFTFQRWSFDIILWFIFRHWPVHYNIPFLLTLLNFLALKGYAHVTKPDASDLRRCFIEQKFIDMKMKISVMFIDMKITMISCIDGPSHCNAQLLLLLNGITCLLHLCMYKLKVGKSRSAHWHLSIAYIFGRKFEAGNEWQKLTRSEEVIAVLES